MRIGVIGFLHESNTFSSQLTTLESFRQSLLVTGENVRSAMVDAHHEVGGFFAGLKQLNIDAVPIFMARALPSGTIAAADFDDLVRQLMDQLQRQLPLNGILVAPHGATVSEKHLDADGYWLAKVREAVGPDIPIMGTLDAHANLSSQMVDSCDALIAYRTNPHLDQRERGIEAARMLVRTINGDVSPKMAAVFPPMAISIDRQCTEEEHLAPLYRFADRQLESDGILSNSILLGFPYSDVEEFGSSVIVVTDDDQLLADKTAAALGDQMWQRRELLSGQFTSVDEAMDECEESNGRTCLLDMGDNVGGGSSADGTELIGAIHRRRIGPAFGCLFDPEAVSQCRQAGIGSQLRVSVGGKADSIHGESLTVNATVKSFHDGRFFEPEPRHGGITEFEQGETAICETEFGLTLMLTSKRMVPFSLQQLKSCGIDPTDYRILVAKGVNAPIAAYREACERFIRVNTIGSTCADMTRLPYTKRRRPMFPFEADAEWKR